MPGIPASSSTEFVGRLPASWSKFQQKEKEAEDAQADVSPDTGQPEGKREAEQDADDLLLAAPHGPDRVRHL